MPGRTTPSALPLLHMATPRICGTWPAYNARVSVPYMRRSIPKWKRTDVLTGEVDEQPLLNCTLAHCPSAEHK
eukprot:15188656-Heterocapsa_arctica.AAC.1